MLPFFCRSEVRSPFLKGVTTASLQYEENAVDGPVRCLPVATFPSEDTMHTAPKSLRLHIGLFGRTNVGKSSFLNFIVGQQVAITSPIPGTTTDVVEKTMELLPVGPVVFLDTAGIDDISTLAEKRIAKSKKIFDRADVIVLIVESQVWTSYEEYIFEHARQKKIPIIIVINKIDQLQPSENFIALLLNKTPAVLLCSSVDLAQRDTYINRFKELLIAICPEGFLAPPALIGDIVPASGLVVLIIPIDFEAPKGRIILPQVQTIRDALDHDTAVMVVKENGYQNALRMLQKKPDLVVCDSQVVLHMVQETPVDIPCTTFSILLARQKGDLTALVRGVKVLQTIQPGDRLLIAEACSHHAIEGDIGRVKIPALLRAYAGGNLVIDVCSGRDYVENLASYKVIIHCGACMLNRREMMSRIYRAQEEGVAITNYGVCIAFLHGVLERVLAPFPDALEIYQRDMHKGVR